MKLIVGLGNPGKEYEKTRHNAGFMVLDHFVDNNSPHVLTTWEENKLAHAEVLTAEIGNEKIILAKPLTYMNNSGHAVSSLLGKFKLKPQDLIVIYDDFDLDLGLIRVRNSGSSGGHNGVKSLMEVLKTEEFVRIRLGIGNQNDSYFTDKKIPRQDYVLKPFLELEERKVTTMIDGATRYISLLVTEGYESFMSKHHGN